MAKRVQDVLLQVEYVPLPVEREASWRAGVFLLLQILKGEEFYRSEEAVDDIDVLGKPFLVGGDGVPSGSVVALLPVEADLEG